MAIQPDLLAILRCPDCLSRGVSDDEATFTLKDDNRLVCAVCRKAYPIRDGIPVLLIEEATVELSDEETAEQDATS